MPRLDDVSPVHGYADRVHLRRYLYARASRVEASRRALDAPFGVAGRARRPGAHCHPEDLRPSALRARGPPVRRRGAARRQLPLPYRRRRDRSSRTPDVRRPPSLRRPRAKRPKDARVQAPFEDGGALVLTEGGPRSARKSASSAPRALDAELDHLGPEARVGRRPSWRRSLDADSRRLHALLRDQRTLQASAAAGRTRSSTERGSRRTRSRRTSTGGDGAAGGAIRELLAAGLELALRASRTRRPTASITSWASRARPAAPPIARVDFEEHTVFFCPQCQTGGRVLKDRRLSRLLR